MTRLLAAVHAMLRSIAYAAVPEARGKRDLRIDLLRGFCVFVMTVDHVGGESSWLYVLTGGNHFYVSAAEGFVLLSGIAMGMVHASTIGHARGTRSSEICARPQKPTESARTIGVARRDMSQRIGAAATTSSV